METLRQWIVCPGHLQEKDMFLVRLHVQAHLVLGKACKNPDPQIDSQPVTLPLMFREFHVLSDHIQGAHGQPL